MKNKIKKIANEAKDHVKRQKFAYLWGSVAVMAIALQQSNIKAFTAFLTEKGIDPTEYFTPEYFEELNS